MAQPVRVRPRVDVEQRHEGRTGELESPVDGDGEAAMIVQSLQADIFGVGLEPGSGAVGRGIVDHDDRNGPVGLSSEGGDAAGEPALRVPQRDDDVDSGQVGHVDRRSLAGPNRPIRPSISARRWLRARTSRPLIREATNPAAARKANKVKGHAVRFVRRRT